MPSDLLAARTQMAVSLGFHIIFAEISVAMPLLMVLAEWRWRRTGDPAFRELAGRWARGTAILFAVGAVSGTVLSFEQGLLWPGFMRFAGAIIGMPFSLEGFAAPEIALRLLLTALACGSVLLIPSLIYPFRTFSRESA
ncbi:hypothetical protein BH09GEM1_BH09GEM1_39750 [soil metagenome]